MLAADHRWQWEDFCDARSLPRERIRDAKRVAYEGFVRAREQSAAARQFGALLIDEQYSSAVIADALKAGLAVGTPAEKAGAIPLAWATDPFSAALTGAFVKVLARYRRDDKAETLAEQWAKLEALQSWCRGQGKPLVLEVLVARKDEPEDEFESSGRPAMLAEFIAEAYRRGLTPEFWKIEGTLSAARRPHDRHSDCRAPVVPADHPREGRGSLDNRSLVRRVRRQRHRVRLRHRALGLLGAFGRVPRRKTVRRRSRLGYCRNVSLAD